MFYFQLFFISNCDWKKFFPQNTNFLKSISGFFFFFQVKFFLSDASFEEYSWRFWGFWLVFWGFVFWGFFVGLVFLCYFNLFGFAVCSGFFFFFVNKIKAGDLSGLLYILLAVYFPSETKSHAKFPVRSQRNLPVGAGAMLAICKRRQWWCTVGQSFITGKMSL